MFKTTNGQIAAEQVDRVMVIAIGKREIEDSAWSEYLAALLAMLKPGAEPRVGALVYSPVVGPNAHQRKDFLEVARKLDIDTAPTALLSDSLVARGALTALGWLSRKSRMRAFSATRYLEATRWLHEELGGASPAETVAKLRELAEAVGYAALAFDGSSADRAQ